MIVYAEGINPPGPFTGENPIEVISKLISFMFQVVLIVAALYSLFQIIMAGYDMISSGGDKASLESARGKIIWAITGLVIVLASWGLIILVEHLLGIGLGFSKPIDIGFQ